MLTYRKNLPLIIIAAACLITAGVLAFKYRESFKPQVKIQLRNTDFAPENSTFSSPQSRRKVNRENRQPFPHKNTQTKAQYKQ